MVLIHRVHEVKRIWLRKRLIEVNIFLVACFASVPLLLFLHFCAFLAHCSCQNALELYQCSCPPTRDWGSRVSGIVDWEVAQLPISSEVSRLTVSRLSYTVNGNCVCRRRRLRPSRLNPISNITGGSIGVTMETRDGIWGALPPELPSLSLLSFTWMIR